MTPKVIKQAAKLINNAKRVLFLTSAGMSADSNIPTFRDKDGYWKNFPPFKKKIFKLRIWQAPGPSEMNWPMHGPFTNGDDKMLVKTHPMLGIRS